MQGRLWEEHVCSYGAVNFLSMELPMNDLSRRPLIDDAMNKAYRLVDITKASIVIVAALHGAIL